MSRRTTRAIVLSLVCTLWGSGCVLEESVYPEERAAAECRTMRRCHRAQFDGEHEGLDDCIADLAEGFADSPDTDCAYDPDKASECVYDIRTATCADAWDTARLYSACQDVYDCP